MLCTFFTCFTSSQSLSLCQSSLSFYADIETFNSCFNSRSFKGEQLSVYINVHLVLVNKHFEAYPETVRLDYLSIQT